MHYPPLFFNPPPQLRTYLVANIETEKKCHICQLLLRAGAAAPLAKKKVDTVPAGIESPTFCIAAHILSIFLSLLVFSWGCVVRRGVGLEAQGRLLWRG